MSLSELMIEIPAEYEANVFGQFDVYVKKTGKDISCNADLPRWSDQDRGGACSGREGAEDPEPACRTCPKRQYDHRTECRLCNLPCI